MLAIPAVLVAVSFLSADLRRSLVLHYVRPTLVTMYTSHFVHAGVEHLLANLLVYLSVVPFSLLVSIRNGDRRQFYVVAITFLTVFPFVFSLLNVLFPRPRVGLGFSGINLAFVGYLPHVLADALEEHRGESGGLADPLLPLAFFLGTAIVTAQLARSIGLHDVREYDWLVLAGVGSLLVSAALLWPVVGELRAVASDDGGGLPAVVGFGGALYVLMVLVGFPTVPAEGGGLINLLVHFLGFSFGYVVPYVAFRLLEVDVTATTS
ncbi:MAG: hypothetical protein ABEK02_00910 [Haloquadratum sp.]